MAKKTYLIVGVCFFILAVFLLRFYEPKSPMQVPDEGSHMTMGIAAILPRYYQW